MTEPKLDDEDYRKILDFRVGLRRFLEWSGEQATEAGVTPTQHQLLLAVRGIDHRRGVTIGDLAEVLVLRHHSAVELVDRAVTKGIVMRTYDPGDRRLVRVKLTPRGERALERITRANVEELTRLAPRITRLLGRLSEEPR